MVRSCALACLSASFCAAVSPLASSLLDVHDVAKRLDMSTCILVNTTHESMPSQEIRIIAYLCRFRSSLSASLAAFAAALAAAFSFAFRARSSAFASFSAAACCGSFLLPRIAHSG